MLHYQVNLDAEMIQSIVRLAKTLNRVDEHVYNLYLMSYTGLRGTSAKSPQSTGEIRGVSPSIIYADCTQQEHLEMVLTFSYV